MKKILTSVILCFCFSQTVLGDESNVVASEKNFDALAELLRSGDQSNLRDVLTEEEMGVLDSANSRLLADLYKCEANCEQGTSITWCKKGEETCHATCNAGYPQVSCW